MSTALLLAMAKHRLLMTDYCQQDTGGAPGCQFAFHEGHFQWSRADNPRWQDVELKHLLQRLARPPEHQSVDIHIFGWTH